LRFPGSVDRETFISERLHFIVDDADSDRVKADAKLANGLGEIVVHVHRAIAGLSLTALSTSAVKEPTNEIAEKALKGQAISHGVT
jgi:hypothetical protein